MHVIAVDWSGARHGARRKIWRAHVENGSVVELVAGLDRDEVVELLVGQLEQCRELVVGLDFAFSFPQWFCEQLCVHDGPALWRRVAEDGEAWLGACDAPFWGRPGKRRPDIGSRSPWRRTDRAGASGHRPKSVFQIGGAGAVGTGSIRGMPHLARLHDAGFGVWPFTASELPLVVEIYPRFLSGSVNKSSRDARRTYLVERAFGERVPGRFLDRAIDSDDAFDALVSAVTMSEHAAELAALPRVRNLEGQIWKPAGGPATRTPA